MKLTALTMIQKKLIVSPAPSSPPADERGTGPWAKSCA